MAATGYNRKFAIHLQPNRTASTFAEKEWSPPDLWAGCCGSIGISKGSLRLDNGTELTAKYVREWFRRLAVKLLFIEPGSLWKNVYIESFTGKMRDGLKDREIIYSIKEAQVSIEMWRNHYSTIGPHSSPGYRPPVPATIVLQPSYFKLVGLV